MNTEKVIGTKKIIFAANLVIGLLLLASGIILNLTDSDIVENNRAIIALAFIPLAISLSTFLNLLFIKKKPKSMKSIIISESDERMIAIRNEADSRTFRILRWALTLVFLGYTFLTPEDIFEAASWWITFAFLFLSYMLQGIFYKIGYDKNEATNEEDE